MIFFVIALLFLCFQNSSALTCMGCELSNSSDTCDFSYTCPDGVEFCETLVSKVEGSYSLILSCATMKKCGNYSDDQGLDKCDYKA